jgi:hypothetical protein
LHPVQYRSCIRTVHTKHLRTTGVVDSRVTSLSSAIRLKFRTPNKHLKLVSLAGCLAATGACSFRLNFSTREFDRIRPSPTGTYLVSTVRVRTCWDP